MAIRNATWLAYTLTVMVLLVTVTISARAQSNSCVQEKADPSTGITQNDDLAVKVIGDVAVEVQAATAWRPRGGEVRLNVSSKAGVKQIEVCFEWSEAHALGRFSSNVRLLSPDEGGSRSLDTVTFGVIVPDLPSAPSQWLSGTTSGFPDRVALGTVPLANMRVTVTTNSNTVSMFITPVGVTNVWVSCLIVLFLLFLFCFAVKVLSSRAKRRPEGGMIGAILWLITGADGFASLSQFQIMLWTVTVALSAVYVMALSGNLIDIPPEMLQLLGITGGAALLARIPPKGGLRNATRPLAAPAEWSDLIVIDGNLDVTRVQMLIFTLISAAFVALKVVVDYQISDIPQNFVLLMGISNGVYLTGRQIQDTGGSCTLTQQAAPAPAPLPAIINKP